MAVAVIPLDSEDDRFFITTTLEGQQYGLTFRWNTRDAGWWFTVSDAAGVDVYTGRLVAEFADLLFPCPDLVRKPLGQLLVQDTTGAAQDPARGDLGARALLTYVELSTLNAASQRVVPV